MRWRAVIFTRNESGVGQSASAGVQPPSLADQKTQAEIDEIRYRTRWDKWLGAPAKYFAIIVPLAVAVAAAWVQIGEYLDQRERLARFDVGQEIIGLVEQLRDSSNSEKQAVAAYELSWFGRPAVMLLFQQLAAENRPNVHAAIVVALAEIARGDTEEPSTVVQIARATEAYIVAMLEAPKAQIVAMEGYLRALAAAEAAIRGDDETVDPLYIAILKRIKSKIENQSVDPSAERENPLTEEEKAQLLDVFDQEFTNLTVG